MEYYFLMILVLIVATGYITSIKKGRVAPPKLRSELSEYRLHITRHDAISYTLKK